MSAFEGNVLQLFAVKTSNNEFKNECQRATPDSKRWSAGLDYCAIAMQQRVLQHIRG
jgi:hypothetical protein